MDRLPRFDLPGIAQHVVQRGNSRLPCFLDDGVRLRYLQLLAAALLATGCRLHAYVLMDNHVHLLVTPPETGALGRLMQRLGRSYVAPFNGRHGRTGTLWEGRYKACLVDSERYVLRCYRYIELNPLRARLIDDPAAYRWSSCAANTGQRPASGLIPHEAWLALGSTPAERASAYRTFWTKHWTMTLSPKSAAISSNNAPSGMTPSAAWSKQRPDASPEPVPPTGHPARSHVRSEPDPVIF